MPIAPIRFLGGHATDNTYTDPVSRNWYRIDEVSEQLNMLNEESAIFYKILSMFRRGPSVMQPKYTWWKTDVPAVLTRINLPAGYLSTDTTLVVDDATIFTPNAAVLNQRTNEQMIVQSIPSTTSIVVTRGQLSTVAAAIVDNDELVSLGPALSEKGVANLANSQLPVSDWNYVSFFSMKKQVTELQENTEMRFNINMPDEMKRGWFELQRQINMAILHGRKNIVDDASVGRFYYSDGFIPQLKTNRLDLSLVDGVLTWPQFNDWCRTFTQYSAGSSSRTIVAGTSLFAALNQISYNQTTPVSYNETLGTMVKSIVSDEGLTLDIVLDRHSFPARHAGWGIVVDMNQVQLRSHQGFDFHVRPNIQSNDAHIREDEIYGSESVQVIHEEVHGLITGCAAPY